MYLDEHYDLYARYIEYKHTDGDMYPPSKKQFSSFLSSNLDFAFFYEYRCNGYLLAVAAVDELDCGLSSVYTFYDPQERKRSLGGFSILDQIARVKHARKSFLYLGYWIKNCQKMNYKSQYQPLELFLNKTWMRYSENF
ncbi:UNVERIFIED_CONTAM: hypothetical protein GTU68_021844 [Idotea baltica]|nr:hypothetical protein [Idotea baltica]